MRRNCACTVWEGGNGEGLQSTSPVPYFILRGADAKGLHQQDLGGGLPYITQRAPTVQATCFMSHARDDAHRYTLRDTAHKRYQADYKRTGHEDTLNKRLPSRVIQVAHVHGTLKRCCHGSWRNDPRSQAS